MWQVGPFLSPSEDTRELGGAAVLPTIVLSPRWALQVSTDLLALPPDLKLKSQKQTLFS